MSRSDHTRSRDKLWMQDGVRVRTPKRQRVAERFDTVAEQLDDYFAELDDTSSIWGSDGWSGVESFTVSTGGPTATERAAVPTLAELFDW